MHDAPKQDWPMLERLSRSTDAAWIRGLTPADRFAIYADLFDLIWQARRDPGEWKRLEDWHWKHKLATRLRMVDAFNKLDRIGHE
jgi:hypothetical protein